MKTINIQPHPLPPAIPDDPESCMVDLETCDSLKLCTESPGAYCMAFERKRIFNYEKHQQCKEAWRQAKQKEIYDEIMRRPGIVNEESNTMDNSAFEQ